MHVFLSNMQQRAHCSPERDGGIAGVGWFGLSSVTPSLLLSRTVGEGAKEGLGTGVVGVAGSIAAAKPTARFIGEVGGVLPAAWPCTPPPSIPRVASIHRQVRSIHPARKEDSKGILVLVWGGKKENPLNTVLLGIERLRNGRSVQCVK